MSDEHIWREACSSWSCQQGDFECRTPEACRLAEPSEQSWLWSDLSILGIFVLVVVGFIAGWFGG